MTEPDVSPLPLCERCRKHMPCVLVETVYGERSLCISECFKFFCLMRSDLKKRVAELLQETDANFFDEPTVPNRKVLKP